VTGILLTGGQQGYSTPDLPGLPHLLSSENDSITYRIVFSPTGLGEFLDTLMVLDDDTTGNMLSSIVHGKGVLIARADAGLLYALGATPGGEALYTLDSTAGTATLHTGIDVSGFVDAAVRGVDTTVYGIVPSSLSSDVYKISTGGSAVKSVSVPVGNLRALAFSPGDTLFAGSANGGFYRIDRVTGSASLLGTMPGLDYSGLAFEPSSGILWASARHPIDSIYTVNTANGSATFVGTTGFNALTASLAFSPSGMLYGLIDNGTGENYLAVISTVNGAGTLIGPTVAGDLSAIAIVPPLTGPLAVQQPRDGDLPASYHLFQNYPNPFNPETSIEYTVGVSGQQSAVSLVRLRVYDVLGREVARLVNEEKTPGTYTAKFDGSDLSSGLYFYRLESGSFSSTRKMLLLR